MKSNLMCQACASGPKHSSKRMRNLLDTLKRVQSDIKMIESYLSDPEVVEIINQQPSCKHHTEHHEQSLNIFQ